MSLRGESSRTASLNMEEKQNGVRVTCLNVYVAVTMVINPTAKNHKSEYIVVNMVINPMAWNQMAFRILTHGELEHGGKSEWGACDLSECIVYKPRCAGPVNPMVEFRL